MSHQVVINYEALSIECRAICKVAAKQLCQIDEFLRKIEETSRSLMGDETENMKKSLKNHAAVLQSRINELVNQSEITGARGIVTTNSDYGYGNGRDIVHQARALSMEVNRFTTGQVANYHALLDRLLALKVSEHNRDIMLRASGTVVHNEEFSRSLAEIQDEALKGFIYHEWLDNKNAGKSFEEFKGIAEKKMKEGAENYLRREQKKIVADIETEMREAQLDEETVTAVLKTESSDVKSDLERIREKATEEIVRETVRKQTLKVVMDCIEKNGFIVDRKNIKLQKDKNEVVMIAQKASGEKAEFRVMLDGKFIYKFDGYEGQACQEDIKPFMNDLKEIYGIKVTDIKEIWRNPDKLSSQKYQQLNVNSNKE
jgi:uncharacterized protein YbjQ (UPF0145 family)